MSQKPKLQPQKFHVALAESDRRRDKTPQLEPRVKPRPRGDTDDGDESPPLLLSKATVLKLLDGISYSCLYSWMRTGNFPLAIQLGPEDGQSSKIAWRASEVHDWIATRPYRKLTPVPIKDQQVAAQHQHKAPQQRRKARGMAR